MTLSRSPSLRSYGGGLALVFCMALLSAVGCKKDPPPPTENKTEVKPAPTLTDKGARKNRNDDEGVEVTTEEDFEDAVEKQITATSDLGKELDQLEKQIAGQ
ncbi:MAG: hypothetical protein RL685_3122 [Pseudomonadota bacterium]|jgi:hypothetical protein